MLCFSDDVFFDRAYQIRVFLAVFLEEKVGQAVSDDHLLVDGRIVGDLPQVDDQFLRQVCRRVDNLLLGIEGEGKAILVLGVNPVQALDHLPDGDGNEVLEHVTLPECNLYCGPVQAPGKDEALVDFVGPAACRALKGGEETLRRPFQFTTHDSLLI